MTAAALVTIGRQSVVTAITYTSRSMLYALRVDKGLGNVHERLYNQLTALTIDKAISQTEFEVQAWIKHQTLQHL